jgi:hypothetical protein
MSGDERASVLTDTLAMERAGITAFDLRVAQIGAAVVLLAGAVPGHAYSNGRPRLNLVWAAYLWAPLVLLVAVIALRRLLARRADSTGLPSAVVRGSAGDRLRNDVSRFAANVREDRLIARLLRLAQLLIMASVYLLAIAFLAALVLHVRSDAPVLGSAVSRTAAIAGAGYWLVVIASWTQAMALHRHDRSTRATQRPARR